MENPFLNVISNYSIAQFSGVQNDSLSDCLHVWKPQTLSAVLHRAGCCFLGCSEGSSPRCASIRVKLSTSNPQHPEAQALNSSVWIQKVKESEYFNTKSSFTSKKFCAFKE